MALADYRPHEAYFGGNNNHMKTKALYFLYLYSDRAFSVAEIARYTGINYQSLMVKIGKWVKWKYVKRKVRVPETGQPLSTYVLAKRGEDFLRYRVPEELLKKTRRELP